jgi:hypothetical protein
MLCYLLTLDLLPGGLVDWMSEDTWRLLWLTGSAGALLGLLLSIFTRRGIRAPLAIAAGLLAFAWLIAMGVAEPGA